MGISPSEFTDASGPGRINLFGGGGAKVGRDPRRGYATQASLTAMPPYSSVHVLMLPCEGGD